MQQLVEWQRIDPDNGLVFPWWTWPFMDMLKMGDYSRLNWLEFGAGRSTTWLRSRAKWVTTIESNHDWARIAIAECEMHKLHNGRIWSGNISDGTDDGREVYFRLLEIAIEQQIHKGEPHQFDVISVDGIYRYEAIRWAINHFKGRTGLLIIDNLDQDYVFISPGAMDLIAPFHQEIFIQPGHVNHEGRPWNTRAVYIPK